MAYIEHCMKDAENIFVEIKYHEEHAWFNVFMEYKAAKTIQRYFRGYITRKHMKHLHQCAIMIQKHWRRFISQRYFSQLLKETVHKMYLDHYNHMAQTIQRVWRGYYVRKHVFSFYELKEYIRNILESNKNFLQFAKECHTCSEYSNELNRQQKCQELLTYYSFRIHHLIRTHQIEGVYSKHGSLHYSAIEQQLKNVSFLDFMNMKHAQKVEVKPHTDYIFEGKLRECEEAWLHRIDPGKFGLSTGEYGQDEREMKIKQKNNEKLLQLQDRPMCFETIRYDDLGTTLNFKQYRCPRLHRTIKKENK